MKRKLNIFDNFDEIYNELGEGIPQCHFEDAKFFASLISLPKSSKVLDIGCAEGLLSIVLAKKGYNVTSIDISQNMILQTKKRAENECVKITTEVCDIEDEQNIKLINGPFDAVFLMSTIEHLRSPIIALTNIHSLLNNGGFLIINTPNTSTPNSLLYSIYFHHTIRRFNVGELGDLHLQFYSHDSLTQLLAFAGFRVTTFIPNQVVIHTLKSKKLSQMFPKLSESVLLISKKTDLMDLTNHLEKWRLLKKSQTH